MADELNPYEPPRSIVTDQSPIRKPRWRLIPATILLAMGGYLIVVGLVYAGVLASVAFTRGVEVHLIVDGSFCLGIGAAWIVSGHAFWRQRYTLAYNFFFLGLIFWPVAACIAQPI